MTNPSDEGNFDKKPPVRVEQYDKSMRLFCGAYEEIFKICHSCLRANLPEKAKVLVAGAGTGMEVLEFAPLNSGWSFYGIDPSADMLAVAKKKITEKHLPNEIELKQGYIDDLKNKEAFDGATCILVMHFLNDDGSKLALLKSISKRLKQGAIFILIDGFGEQGSTEFEKIKTAWMNYPLIKGVSRENIEKAFSEIIMKMVQFVPESRILELMKLAGFTNVYKFYTGFLYGGWAGYKE